MELVDRTAEQNEKGRGVKCEGQKNRRGKAEMDTLLIRGIRDSVAGAVFNEENRH